MYDATGTGPRRYGLPSSRQKSSARVPCRHNLEHGPRGQLIPRYQSLGWTLAHAVGLPVQPDRLPWSVHENSIGPHWHRLCHLACRASSALYDATNLCCKQSLPARPDGDHPLGAGGRGGCGRFEQDAVIGGRASTLPPPARVLAVPATTLSGLTDAVAVIPESLASVRLDKVPGSVDLGPVC